MTTISEGGAWRSPDVARCMPIVVNVSDDEFYGNIRSAIKRDMPWLQQEKAHDRHAVLVGGGPSLEDHIEEIRQRVAHGQTIIAMNNTASWLEDRGITPDFHILLDARLSMLRFVTKNPKTRYLIASQCNPAVLDATEHNATLWHPHVEGIQEIIGDVETALIGGGTTVGLQAMSIAYALGYRVLHLYGYDSSYRKSEGHAYTQPENDGEEVIKVHFDGNDYMAARWMVNQADEFKNVVVQLTNLDCEITIRGDGLIPAVMKNLTQPPKRVLTAVYDLYCSPPSYDFASFLCAAERARLEGGYDSVDIVFQPGPKYGFRNDELPPNTITRDSMLWRICVDMCRLLPSVRNVTILKEREALTGNLFPEGWAYDNPVSCYGTWLFKDVPHALRATPKAKQSISEHYKRPYVTITVRECEYYPRRNSNMREWSHAAEYIEAQGYDVVWVHDTDSTLHAASWDIDLRMALYEGAVCNLGVVNGPIVLLMLSNIPYLAFKPVVSDYYTSSILFINNNGLQYGDQIGPNGRLIWENDDADVIIRAFDEFLTTRESL